MLCASFPLTDIDEFVSLQPSKPLVLLLIELACIGEIGTFQSPYPMPQIMEEVSSVVIPSPRLVDPETLLSVRNKLARVFEPILFHKFSKAIFPPIFEIPYIGIELSPFYPHSIGLSIRKVPHIGIT